VEENESLFIACQTVKAPARVMHTIVFDRLVGLDLKIRISKSAPLWYQGIKRLTTTE
jgi:hypothetical protein